MTEWRVSNPWGAKVRDPGFFRYAASNRGPASAKQHFVLHRVQDTRS